MTFSLVLDLVVAVLLVVTIGYAVVLNRRLSELRRNKADLESAASSFGAATGRAEESIARLKTTADELHQRIEKAQALRDDLVFLIERGGTAADRLEESVRAARKEGDVGPRTGVVADLEEEVVAEEAEEEVEAKSEAERELLKALQSVR